MPIETDIPMEIDGYQKKIVFGLTLRQLICAVLAVLLAVGTYFVCAGFLRFSTSIAGWVVMLVACPLMAIGFIRPHGEPFERFFKRKLRHYLGNNRLCYTAEPAFRAGGDTANSKGAKLKGGIKRGNASIALAAENTFRFRAGPGRKRRRKQTANRIKAAKKEYRAAAARAKREALAATGV